MTFSVALNTDEGRRGRMLFIANTLNLPHCLEPAIVPNVKPITCRGSFVLLCDIGIGSEFSYCV